MFFQVSRTTFNDVMEPQCIAPNKNFQIRQIIGKTVAVYNRKQRKNFADNRQKKKICKNKLDYCSDACKHPQICHQSKKLRVCIYIDHARGAHFFFCFLLLIFGRRARAISNMYRTRAYS